MKPFFIKIPNFWAWAAIWADKFWGIWYTFGRFISNHFGTVSPLSMLSINQLIFLQKIGLYILIPNIYLGLGFGLQKNRDLAIVCL